MKTLSKALAGTIAAGAMVVASTSPAHASGGKIGAGEIIAGALVIGGIAAIAASGSSKRDRYGYDGYDRYGYRGGDQSQAVNMCVRAAERRASRASYGRAHVTDIRRVDRKRDGFNVEGRIAVDSRYSRRGYDSGRFKCKVRYGRVTDLDFKSIRGL